MFERTTRKDDQVETRKGYNGGKEAAADGTGCLGGLEPQRTQPPPLFSVIVFHLPCFIPRPSPHQLPHRPCLFPPARRHSFAVDHLNPCSAHSSPLPQIRCDSCSRGGCIVTETVIRNPIPHLLGSGIRHLHVKRAQTVWGSILPRSPFLHCSG